MPGQVGTESQLFLQEAKQSISKRKASDAASPALDAAAASATVAAEESSPSKRMKAASDPSQVPRVAPLLPLTSHMPLTNTSRHDLDCDSISTFRLLFCLAWERGGGVIRSTAWGSGQHMWAGISNKTLDLDAGSHIIQHM